MYQFTSRVRYSEINSDGSLSWVALLDYFQDSSIFHSEELDLSVDYLRENHMAWVLSSWQICVNRMPGLAEEIVIQTWPYEMKGFYGFRNFCLNDKMGNRLAYANSIWVLMDTLTGHPIKVPQDMCEKYGTNPPIPMESKGRKIRVPEIYEEKEPLVVPSFFIDTNHHMNNGRYVQVALTYLPEDDIVREIRVEYKKAAMQGDVLIPHVTLVEAECVVTLCGEDGVIYAVVAFLTERKTDA